MKFIKENKIVLLILLIAFLFRVWGLYPGYPPYHPDEPQIYSRALLILKLQEEKLGYWGYPALIPILHAVTYGLFFIPVNFLIDFFRHFNEFRTLEIARFFQVYIYGTNDINVLYWGRFVNVVLGSVCAVATYIVAKKFFNSSVGLFAGFSIAVNYRHVLSSHFALPDVANGLFFLITILTAGYILNKSTLRNYIFAAVSAAMSFSVKLSPFALFSVFVAHLIASKSILHKTFWVRSLILLSIFILVVVIINIFHITHFEALLEDFETLNKRYLSGNLGLLIYPYSYFFKSALGPILSLLSIFGIFYGLKFNFKKTILLLIPLLLFFFSLTIYSIGGAYARNFVAIIPLLLIFSGVGIYNLLVKLKLRKQLFTPILLIVMIFANFSSFKDVVIANASYTTQWNMDKLKNYFSKGYEGKIITANSWFASYAFPQEVERRDFLLNLSEAQEEGADFALIDTDSTEYLFTWWMASREPAFIWQPTNLLLETFAGGSLKQILALRSDEFTKPVSETNFYIIPIPKFEENIKGQIIMTEQFNTPVEWKLKGLEGWNTPNISHIIGQPCGGCIQIRPLTSEDTKIGYLLSKGTSQFYRFTSKPLELVENMSYNISVEITSSEDLDKIQRDGFFKVELYKSGIEAQSNIAGEYIFVSARHWKQSKRSKEIVFSVPKGFKYMTISFQRDKNGKSTLYFDNLIVRQLEEQLPILEPKQFPKELLFVESIL